MMRRVLNFHISWSIGFALALLLPSQVPAFAADDSPKRNVLFIGVDDLRTRLGCYGETGVKSPNIDRLAARGMRFERAYCTVASCGPSRSCLLTGRRPDTVRIFGNRLNIRDTLPDVVTLPQQFKRHGYHTQSFGKIFHGIFTNEIREDPRSWSAPSWRPLAIQYATPEGIALLKRLYPKAFSDPNRTPQEVMGQRRYKGLAWEAPDVADEELIDGAICRRAMETLRQLKDRPFFLAVGFVKPHAPYVAPKKYFDLYELEDIELPANHEAPEGMPDLAHRRSLELRGYHPIPMKGPIPDQQARQVIRAYNACVSYVDAQVGKLLEELDRLGLADNTIVVLWGDHGYHLGHNGQWCKNTNFEAAVRVPLIVAAPRHETAGGSTRALVELVDLFPTLCDLCDVPLTEGLEGTSFKPLLANPELPWKQATFSQHPRPLYNPKAAMGRSIRTEEYRYTEWRRPGEEPCARELYRYDGGIAESDNLIDRAEYAQMAKDMAARLRAGWEAARPNPTVRVTELTPVASNPKIHYGFPRLVRAANGDLLLFYRVGTTHAQDDSEIAMRRSTDNGRTWGDERILWKAPPGFSAHNPVALVTPQGRVILWASSYKYSVKPPRRLPGYWAHSTDHGKTWSPFTRFDNDPSRSIYYVNEVICTSDGLLAAGDAHPPGGLGDCRTLIFHSSDDGRTWSPRSWLTGPDENKGDEVALMETEPGTLLCLLRDRQRRETYRYWSRDAGHTWSPRESLREMLDCTLQRPFLTRLDDRTFLLSGRDAARRKVVVYLSRDNGKHFGERTVLERYQGDGGYTSAVPLDHSTVRMVWYSDAATNKLKPDIKSARLTVSGKGRK